MGAGLRRTERRWNRRSEAYKHQQEQERRRRVVLQERTDIARELHDSVAHHLTLITVQCEARLAHDPAGEDVRAALGNIGETARQALGELDQILNALRLPQQQQAGDVLLAPQAAPCLHDLPGLLATVSAQADGLPMDLSCDLGADVDTALSQAAYRIIQEALTNVIRHANARRAAVTVTVYDNCLVVTVVDDGDGVPSNRASSRVGNGLLGMSERAHVFGGSVQLVPGSPRGTRLVAELPLPPRSPLGRSGHTNAVTATAPPDP